MRIAVGMANGVLQASKVGKVNFLKYKSLDTQSYLDIGHARFY